MPPQVSSSLPTAEIVALRNACHGWLSGNRPRLTMRDALNELAALPEADQAVDVFGEGTLVAGLERDVATLLGKPASLFMPRGVAAQLAAVRTWAGAKTDALVAVHPQSHMEVDEAHALEHLLGLRCARVGQRDQPFSVADLRALSEPPDIVVVELPLRRGGFRLPPWDELVAIRTWCKERQIPLHLDGARLWESAPFYGRSLAEIADLADSVYVSLYKGLGGLAGCVVAGSPAFIERVRPWQMRLGANLYTVFPYALSAVNGLRQHLPRMPEYCARAQRLAKALVAIAGVRVAPEPPQTNSFQLHLPGDPQRLTDAVIARARSHGFWLGARVLPSSILPGCGMIEVVIGDAADAWKDDRVVSHVRAVLAAANG